MSEDSQAVKNARHFHGDAFPRSTAAHGMTLRDWFAGKALQGFLSDPTMDGTPEDYADSAYRFADAMLKARRK